jgi:hypothetical protein
MRAPIGHEQPCVAHARRGPVLVVHEPDLDLASGNSAGRVDLFHGER